MWYFTWMLGLCLACAFGILNAMWFEMREDGKNDRSAVLQPQREERS